jgi:hypothetical protein
LEKWFKSLPKNWKHHEFQFEPFTVQSDDQNLHKLLQWPATGVVYAYADQWVLFHHSTMLIFRAFLNATVLRCGSWLLGLPVQQTPPTNGGLTIGLLQTPLAKARDNLLHIVDHACRSVHFVRLLESPSYWLSLTSKAPGCSAATDETVHCHQHQRSTPTTGWSCVPHATNVAGKFGHSCER